MTRSIRGIRQRLGFIFCRCVEYPIRGMAEGSAEDACPPFALGHHDTQPFARPGDWPSAVAPT